MRSLSRAAAAAIVALGLVSPCWAGQVKLEIRDGLVTLDAQNASPREILAVWSRVGQTRIVNAERVPGGPLTLQLNRVPEARALDILLRSVAGYVAAPRVVAAGAPVSRFDRLVIMTTPRPAAGAVSPAVAGNPSAPPPVFEQRRRMGYQPQPNLMVDDQDEPVVQPQQQPPQPMMPPGGAAQPGVLTPGAAQMPYYNPQQQPQQLQQPPNMPNVPGTMTAPAPAPNRPGVMTQPPRPGQQPGQAGPGGN